MSERSPFELHLQTARALAQALLETRDAVHAHGVIDSNRLRQVARGGEPSLRDALDLLFYRFTRLQDRVGAGLFRAILEHEAEEYTTQRDMLELMERLGVLDSVEEWLALRELRNALTHDYPDDLDAAAENIHAALARIPKLLEAVERAGDYGVAKGLIARWPLTAGMQDLTP